jgi:hypothetical protein
MIIRVKRPKSHRRTSARHAEFLALLPAIRRSAQIAFRQMRPELRDDLVHETIANCFATFARLVERGQSDRASPSSLARFAIAQVRLGRRVGNRLRIRDVLSHFAQYRKGFHVESLDHYDNDENCWQQIVIEDKRATPADVAACRLDFSAWLKLLPKRRRKIALALASGETTTAAAQKFGVTAARISQIRQWLKESWDCFQGETKSEERPPLAVA